MTSIYGGPVTLQGLEPEGQLQYKARLSCEWGDPPKFVHRVAIIRLYHNGDVNDVEVKDV